MVKYMTEEEQVAFWAKHDKARKKLDRKRFGLGRLPMGNTLPVDVSSTGVDWSLDTATEPLIKK